MLIENKVVVVTGAGHGIGRALCNRFAQERPRAVAVLDVDADAAEDVAKSVGGKAFRCDVAVEAEIRDVIGQIESQFGGVDLFCANAGIAHPGGINVSDEDWQRVMNVNFMSHVYSARAVIPGMLQRRSGYLLHTASAAGLLTQLGSAPYAVSKHAAVAFAEWLEVRYADRGIRVSCLCPQGVFTQLLEGDGPVLESLRSTAITAEAVADTVVEGLRQECFLILPHPEVATYFQNKAIDYDRWLGGMKKLQRKLFNQQDSSEKPNDA